MKWPIVVAMTVFATGGAATANSLISGSQIRDGSLTSRDVKDGSLKRSDLAPNARGLNGRNGVDGQDGTPGPAGAPGPAGLASIQRIAGPYVQQCASGNGGCQIGGAIATCPAGTVVIAGGFDASTAQDIVTFSEPVANDWRIIASNFWDTSAQVRAYAMCASGPGVSSARSSEGKVQRYWDALRLARQKAA